MKNKIALPVIGLVLASLILAACSCSQQIPTSLQGNSYSRIVNMRESIGIKMEPGLALLLGKILLKEPIMSKAISIQRKPARGVPHRCNL